MTREEALSMVETKWWEDVPLKDAARFQLYEDRLVMPFDLFQNGVQELLGRPVWTHEFASTKKPGGLQEELEGKAGKPTMEKIINLIPPEKRIVIDVGATR